MEKGKKTRSVSNFKLLWFFIGLRAFSYKNEIWYSLGYVKTRL